MAANNSKTLVRMANQIATFFGPYSEEERVAGVHQHVVAFWSPVMRRDLQLYIEQGGEGLMPEVLGAFERIVQGKSPTQRATAGPGSLGQMASDAG